MFVISCFVELKFYNFQRLHRVNSSGLNDDHCVCCMFFYLPLTVNDCKLNILGQRMSISKQSRLQLIFALKLHVTANLIQDKLPK